MKIIKVHSDSLGEAIGVKPGDRLLKINGKRVKDEIDYKFRITEQHISLDFELNGRLEKVEIDKEYDDDLGVIFEDLKIRKCANDCVFCFVDQNPPNMREGMYFRDGDYRMSYLHGHYITMTNMGQNELDRIVEQRLSPLYISVHVTDKVMRRKLFLYKKDDNLLSKIKFLVENNIELHTQIVLMPNLNDGDYLLKTLEDLYKFSPMLRTCTIVPVGLTAHRKGLMEIESITAKYANNLINKAKYYSSLYYIDNSPFIFFSDEWYIVAKKPFPKLQEYGSYDLIENGVGQVQKFLDSFSKDLLRMPKKLPFKKSVTIITGKLIEDIFASEVIPKLNNIKNLTVTLKSVTNNFFGEIVTVSGLLTAKDIIEQLQNEPLGDSVWMSHRILNEDQLLTLDDFTLDDISKALNCKVQIGEDSFLNLVNGLINA
jgi:putative radical SAM enzyme (TIGR03279 family)